MGLVILLADGYKPGKKKIHGTGPMDLFQQCPKIKNQVLQTKEYRLLNVDCIGFEPMTPTLSK